LIVKDVDHAAKQINRLGSNMTEIWLTSAEDPASAVLSVTEGDFQKVDHGAAVRLTRIPSTPTLERPL